MANPVVSPGARKQASASSAPNRAKFQSIWMVLHRYVGLVCSLFVLIVFATGSLLIVEKPLDRWLAPELLTVPVDARKPIGVEAVLRDIDSRYPGRTPAFIEPPPQPGDPYRVALDSLFGTHVYIDPRDGRILGDRPALRSVMAPLFLLHTGYIGGKAGWYVVGALGIAILGLAVTGAWLWWPRRGQWRKHLRIRGGDGIYRWLRDGHRSLGLMLLPWTILITLTGTLIIYHDSTEKVLAVVSGKDELFKTPAKVPGDTAVRVRDGLDAAIARVLAEQDAGTALSYVALPVKPGDAIQLRMHAPSEWHPYGRTAAFLDPRDFSVMAYEHWQRTGWAGRAFNSLYPLHTGDYGGWWGLTIHFVMGWVGVLFAVSGVWMWWRRRPSKRR